MNRVFFPLRVQTPESFGYSFAAESRTLRGRHLPGFQLLVEKNQIYQGPDMERRLHLFGAPYVSMAVSYGGWKVKWVFFFLISRIVQNTLLVKFVGGNGQYWM
jgi:hypothetical protein